MKIQKKLPVLLVTAALFAGQSALTVHADTIGTIRLKIDGTIKSGAVISEEMPEIECSSQKFYLESYDFTNGYIRWDRKDVPQLGLELYPMSNYDFSEKAIRNIRLTGNLHGTFNSFEWIENDEDEESDSGNGVWIYIDLDPVSTPGPSAVKRKAEIEAQYAGMRSKKKAAAAIAATVVDGWYEDSNGWWYLRPDGTYPVNQWETVLGVRCHFNAEGYLDTGWFNADGFWYFAKDSGELLKNGKTPDGYFVNEDGVWIP